MLKRRDVRGRKSHIVVALTNQLNDCDTNIWNCVSMHPAVLLMHQYLLSMRLSYPDDVSIPFWRLLHYDN